MTFPRLILLNTIDCVATVHQFESELYSRWLLEGSDLPFAGQLIVFNRTPSMYCSASEDALTFDFERMTSYDDEPHKQWAPRPGIYLSRAARLLSDCLGPCVVMNGNNIGYWPNQFLVLRGELIYKRVPCLFYEPGFRIDGEFPFVVQRFDGEIMFSRFRISLTMEEETAQIAIEGTKSSNGELKDVQAGISGYPLIEKGEPVWQEYVEQAWDPKLLYFIGEVRGLRRHEIYSRLNRNYAESLPLLRHGLSFLGLLDDGRLACVSVSETGGRGISVGEAAQLLKGLNFVSAIVLGGKGDAQLATWYEGPLIEPLISLHDAQFARMTDALGFNRRSSYLERPVPSIVALR